MLTSAKGIHNNTITWNQIVVAHQIFFINTYNL